MEQSDADLLQGYKLTPDHRLKESKSPIVPGLAHHAEQVHIIRNSLQRRIERFSHLFDGALHIEADRCFAVCSQEFFMHRTSDHIARIILAQYFIRKRLSRSLGDPARRVVEVRFLPTTLSFPFASKPVLGLMIGVNLHDQYELFTEEHALRAVRRLDPEAKIVRGTLYRDPGADDKIKILYLELDKPLSSRVQRHLLEEEIKQSIEKVCPSVFMQNSAEDILKNILTLSREIVSNSDLPQAMIHLEEQSANIVVFRIIFVYVTRGNLVFFDQVFQNISGVVYRLDRSTIVRYFSKKYPVHASVFYLHIPKTADLIRPDASLNFHAARQKISEILYQALGEYRDYNGGLISQQQERLEQMKERFKNCCSELLESFFYSITPLENQATISVEDIASLFQLILQTMQITLRHQADYCLKVVENGAKTLAVFRAGENALQKNLLPLLEDINISYENLTTVQFSAHDSHIWGFILDHHEPESHTRFIEALRSAAAQWAEKIDRLQVLRFAVEFHPYSLDPRIGGDDNSKMILRFLFDGLMRIDPKGQVIPGVAEKVEISLDGTHYLFTLRKSYWSNGDPVTAFDFAYAWKTVLSPNFKTPFAYFFYPIKNAQAVKEGKLPSEALGVSTIDDLTFSVQLEFPVPYFLELVAHTMFSPVNARVDCLCPNWPRQENDAYVCNGAFFLHTNNPPHSYQLMKNTAYWDISRIHLDQVKVIQASEAAALQMFQKNELDWLGFPMKIHRSFSLNPTTDKSAFLPNETVFWYVFNTKEFPFHHYKLRQAFALALNREALIYDFPGTAWPAFTPLPLRHSHTILMEEDPKRAVEVFEEALEELGLNRSEIPSFRILCVKETHRERMSQRAAQLWKETLGIECYVEALAPDLVWKEIFERKFQIVLFSWTAMIDDPSYTLAFFGDFNEIINFPQWENEEYRALFDEGQKEQSAERRQAYFSQAEEILIREVPILPVLRVLYPSIQKQRMSITNHSALKYWDLKWASMNKKQEEL